MNSKRLVQLLLFFVPLVFAPFLYDVFEPIKQSLWTVGTALLCAIFLMDCLQKEKFPVASSALALLLFLQLLSKLLTAIFTPTPSLHFATLSRTLVELSFAYVLLCTPLTEKEIVRPLLYSTLLVSLYALLQKLGLDPIQWTLSDVRVRTVSTLGNPDYLSGYLALILPLYVHLFLESRGSSRAFAFFALTLTFSALLSTYARGGWATFAFLFLLLCILKRNKWCLFLLAYFFCLIALFSTFQVTIDSRPTNTWQRIKGIRDIRYPSFQIRRYLFRDTLHMIRDAPWLGHGQGTFSILFPRYRSKELVLLAGAQKIPEHPHNEYLDLTAEAGLLFLFLYLFTSLFALLHLLRKSPILSLPYLGILLENLFYYPVTPINLLYFTLLGFSLSPRPLIPTQYHQSFQKTLRILLPLCVLAITVSQLLPLSANALFKIGDSLYEDNKIAQSLPIFQQALALDPRNLGFGLRTAETELRLASLLKKKKPEFVLLDHAEETLQKLQNTYGLEPHLLQVRALVLAQRPDHTSRDLDRARDLFLQSLSLDPNNPIWEKNLALFYLSQKDLDNARFHLQRALGINPDYAEALSLLGVIAQHEKKLTVAEAYQVKALQKDPDFLAASIRLILLYYDQKKFHRALSVLAAARLRHSKNPDLLNLEKLLLKKLAK